MSRSFTYILPFLCAAGCSVTPVAIDSVGAKEEPPAISLPILANAGADREVLRGLPVRLDGRGTRGPAGAPPSLSWTQESGPAVILSNPADPSPTFLAPFDETELSFRLTADDGAWVTSDVVTLRVRLAPVGIAPRVRAAADRFVDYAEELLPQHDDIVQIAPEEASATWTQVSIAASPTATGDTLLTGSIFRLEAEADGLWSAPDYLVLLPFDEPRRGERAPTCGLSAPLVVAPGSEIALDAGACTDPNNDTLAFGWEQLLGDSLVLPTADGGAVTAPSQLGQVVIRVTATDGLLESTPADAVIVVSAGEDVSAPEVEPPADVVSHAGNTVWIDAAADLQLGGLAPARDGTPTYLWSQPLGPEIVEPGSEAGGRVLFFPAPVLEDDEPLVLGFAVVAESAGISSQPGTTRITVVPDSQNLGPEVELCAPESVPEAGQPVAVAVRARDPEGDVIASVAWESAAALVASPMDATPPSCEPVGSQPVSFGAGVEAQWLVVGLVSAGPGESVSVYVDVCDALGACGMDEVSVTTAQ